MRGVALPLSSSLLLATVASVAIASDPPREARVRQAMHGVYIHGVTAELARDVLEPADVEVLLRLLHEREFPRRDNVVAFLTYLADDEAVPELRRFLAEPLVGVETPEDDRARLLTPQAYGHIARRGGSTALGELMRLTVPGAAPDDVRAGCTGRGRIQRCLTDVVEMALLGLGLSRRPEAAMRLREIGAGLIVLDGHGRDLARIARDHAEAFFPDPRSRGGRAPVRSEPELDDRAVDGDPSGTAEVAAVARGVEDLDLQCDLHQSGLTYRNHVDLTNPMDSTRLTSVFADSNARAQIADFEGDVGCCVRLAIAGTGGTFGSTGDGLDSIDTSNELLLVLDNPASRVKVVRAINYCSGPGTNIIGCAWIGGNGMALVRTGLAAEGVLWIHEYGHNVGLGHVTDTRYIMYGTDFGTNNGLSQAECNRYHVPVAEAEIAPIKVGPCNDGDGDAIGDACDACLGDPGNDPDGDGRCALVDNCPTVANPEQADSELDDPTALALYASTVTASSQWTAGDYSAMQAAGPPEHPGVCIDAPTNWSPLTDGSGPEWLELRYLVPLRATSISVYEQVEAPFVTAVELRGVDDVLRTMWSQANTTVCGDTLDVTFPLRSYLADTVVVRTAAANFEEIDAVRLEGLGRMVLADGVGDACDNCVGAPNAGQADADADGVGDACDCSPGTPGSTQPGEVIGVLVQKPAPGVARLAWPAVAGSQSYSVTRGDLLAVDSWLYGPCLAEGIAGTTYDDAAVPAAGQGFLYLIQPWTAACGVGTLGYESPGVERFNADPGRCE